MRPSAWTRTAGRDGALGLLACLGLLVLGRTASIYLHSDPLALGIVALMTAGFAFGFVELSVRLRRAAKLAEETGRLPVPATEAAIDAASPRLRAFLRARIEHASADAPGENFTPYLVGLMVMLGLLGTLLGLFETLRGAGLALAESTNVDALRAGLSGPMRGLTRSFGCSAAGVVTSAMLGLSAVLVRRAEARTMGVAQAYANGPLRGLSPLRRQLEALDRLAGQGAALPRSALALEQAGGALDRLAERWEEAHQSALTGQQRAMADAVGRLTHDLDRLALTAAGSLRDTVAPLLERSMQQAVDAATRHMADVADALAGDMAQRREADDAARAVMREELATLRAQLETAAMRQSAEASERLQRLDGALSQHATDQALLLESHREQAAAHVGSLAAAATALSAQLGTDAATRRAEATEWVQQLAERMDGTEAVRAAQAREHVAQVVELGEGLSREAKAREAALSARWERLEQTQAESDRVRTEHMERVAKQLDENLALTALRIDEVLSQRAAADAAQAERARTAFEALAAAGREAERVLGALADRQQGHAAQLGASLSAHAEGLAKGLEGTTALVHDAATVLKATSLEMAAVGEMFAASVERQREAASAWLEGLGEVEGAVERAGRGAAAEALRDQLASTQEVFARQLQFQRELFEHVRDLRLGHLPGATPLEADAELADVSA